MSEQKTEKSLTNPASLNNGPYDAWCLRTAMVARGLPTTSMPGDMVFARIEGEVALAFKHLGSYGTTYAGMGQARSLPRTWMTLDAVGLPVPRFRTVPKGSVRKAELFARLAGLPVLVSSRTGRHRRVAEKPAAVREAVAELSAKLDESLVVSTAPGNQILRILVRGGKVLAVSEDSRRTELSLADVAPELQALAVQAVEAMPGLDMASVTLALASIESVEGAIVERVNHQPHLREFSRGSRQEAQRLADCFVLDAAGESGFSLPPAQDSLSLQIRFTGVAAPERFGRGIKKFADSLGLTRPDGEARIIPDGLELSASGRPRDIAMLITRAGIGLAEDESAHMVESFEVTE